MQAETQHKEEKSAKKQVTKENAIRDEDEKGVECFNISNLLYKCFFKYYGKVLDCRETHEILLYCNRDRDVKVKCLPCVRPVGMNPYSVPKNV